MKKKDDTFIKKCAEIAFGVYMVMLCYFLFVAERQGISTDDAYHYNLTLFKEIGRFWTYRSIVGRKAVLLNLVGNVVGFMPFGFFLPLLSNKNKNGYRVAIFSLFFSLLVELTQLIFKLGCFDVDDILLNTLGGVLGYLMYFTGKKIRRHRDGRQTSQKTQL